MDWNKPFSASKIEQYLDLALDQAVYIIPRLILAFLIIWVGFKVIKKLNQLINGALSKLGVTETLKPFISSIINVALKIFLFMLVANVVCGYNRANSHFGCSRFCHWNGLTRQFR